MQTLAIAAAFATTLASALASSQAEEINFLIPHPIELAFAFHLVAGLAIWLVALVMACTRRITWFPTFVVVWLLLVLPFVGLVAAVVLLFLAKRPATAHTEAQAHTQAQACTGVCPACGTH